MAKTKEEYPIIENCFEYDGKTYDCSDAIERDIKLIIQEAETSHKDSFDNLYDRQSLKADKVRIFLDEEDKPIFGMVIYLIEYAGYISYSDKKGLKNIVQKPTWSKEDEQIILSIEQVMNCASFLNIVPEKIDKIKSWLKSLKERVM